MRNTMPSSLGVVIVASTARAARSACVGVAVVHEQHVDVARVVELASAELAHADRPRAARRRRRSRARPRRTPGRARPARARPRAGRRCRAGRGPRCAAARAASTAADPPASWRVGRVPRARRYVVEGALARRGRRASRSGSSSESSATTADDSERDAHASATRPSRSNGWSASSSASAGCASTARSTSMRAVRASAERSIAASRSGLAERVVPPVMQAVSRILTRCPGSVSPPRSSISSSATSTATSSACSTPTSAPTPPAATSSRSPSSRSPATRPKTSCCARRSSRAAPRRSRRSRRAPAAPRRWSASPRRSATSPTRPRCARTGACRASTASTCCRTTRCSTSSATSRRRPSTVRCSSSAACGSRVTICEDAWSPNGPIITQAAGGAELVVNINASPYYAGRIHERETMLATRAADASVPVLYVNLVGGQDELVFDGASMLFDEGGHLVARARAVRRGPARRRRRRAPRVPAPPARSARPRRAPPRCPRSRSARRDSASTTRRRAIEPLLAAGARGLRGARARHARLRAEERLHRRARRALRRHRLVARRHDRGRRARPRARRRRAHAVALLERRQRHRRRRARRQPRHPHASPCPIEARAHRVPRHARRAVRRAPSPGLAEENLQARIRGTILMAMRNKLGWLVLTAGNKSEMATGYATLYGADMAGGFAVIKDVPKMLVYALARDRNERAVRALDPRVGAREAAERRAAPRPEGLRLAARLRGARPDHRGLRRGRPVDRRARGGRVTTPTPCVGSRASSTATSTSAGRRRPACACRPRRSARIAGCRSPTAGPASPSARARAPRDGGATSRRPRSSVAALLYGITFPLVHDALEDITPFAYLVGRFGIATLLLAPVAIPALRARGAGTAHAACAPGSSPACSCSAATRRRPSGCSTRRRRRRRSSPGCTCHHAGHRVA